MERALVWNFLPGMAMVSLSGPENADSQLSRGTSDWRRLHGKMAVPPCTEAASHPRSRGGQHPAPRDRHRSFLVCIEQAVRALAGYLRRTRCGLELDA